MFDIAPLLTPAIVLALLGGTLWGVIMGALPGITGLTALILALPVATAMEPLPGLVLLISIHAVADTGGAVSAIALAIPGTPSNAATVEDGHALARSGHLSRTIAASAFASGLGGIIGFGLLCLTLPFSLMLVRAAGAPEILAVSCLGLLCAARLGSQSLRQGLMAASFGVFIGLIGTQQSTGEPRMWFGFDMLLDGFSLMAVATGLFAGPELLRLVVSKIDGTSLKNIGEKPVSAGLTDTLKRPKILIKASLVGWLVGILPGVGGSVSGFLSYAWSGIKLTGERDDDSRRDGVIAAEAGNNAKEGGDLIPTLALGLPGGAGMAVLLGAFMVYGIAPGPGFATHHPDIITGIAIALLVSNILGGLLVAFGSPALIWLLNIPRTVLAPLAVAMACAAVASMRGELFDLWTAALFCLIGVTMINLDYSRPALLLGFVLAPIIETYGSISYNAYGWAFLQRPGVVVAILLSGFLVVRNLPALRRRKHAR